MGGLYDVFTGQDGPDDAPLVCAYVLRSGGVCKRRPADNVVYACCDATVHDTVNGLCERHHGFVPGRRCRACGGNGILGGEPGIEYECNLCVSGVERIKGGAR